MYFLRVLLTPSLLFSVLDATDARLRGATRNGVFNAAPMIGKA
jgi:hypothetical protein